MQTAPVRDSVARINATFSALDKAVIGRTAIVEQMKYATITGQHLLMEGPPGVAKSYMVRMFFDVLQGCDTFKVQCTKKMTEDYLVGPLDMKLFREEGVYQHRTEGSLVESHFGFIDEVFDLSSGALRALLEILNERTFTRGVQQVKSPLHTAIATTNFNRDEDGELEAVLDRFLFRAKLEKLPRLEDRMRMLKADRNPIVIPTLNFSDVMRINRAMKRVEINDKLMGVYLKICEGLELTDRTVKRCLDIVRSSAVLSGRSTALVQDLTALETCFVVTNDKTSAQKFGAAMSVYGTALQEQQAKAHVLITTSRIQRLKQFAEAAETYEEILSVAVEAREAFDACNHLGESRGAAECESILKLADTLYQKSQAT